jgi:hypothetical protein
MGLAVDSILTDVATPGTSFTATTVTAGNGDSLTIRNFDPASKAFIVNIIRRHPTAGAVRILSPLLHDNVTGMTFYTSETPSLFEIPLVTEQMVQRGDTLVVQVTGDTVNHASVVTVVYYQNAPGVSAQLYQWGDIANSIKNVKPMTVAVTANATRGLWSDTLITATENQLHATSYYAVLGYTTDTALAAIGVKGQMTGNLRVVGPGATTPEDTTGYFVTHSQDLGMPFIPVFNGQDRAAVYCSVADSAASTTANVTLVLAELTGTYSK